MPKSRGRHPAKRKPSGATPPSSYEGVAIKLAARLLEASATRIIAELLASETLGELVARAKGATPRDRRTTALQGLLAQADRRRTPAAAALLAAVRLLVDNPALEAALADWAGALVVDLPWTTAAMPAATGARRLADTYDDHVIWFVDYPDCILAVSTARWFHHGVLTCSVLNPGPIGELDAAASPVDLATAAGALRDGQQHTDLLSPPHDDPDYVSTQYLLSARLRAFELPDEDAATWEPLDDGARAALLDEFFSESGVDDDETHRALAGACLAFADEHIDGDRLAWSPEIVEVFLDGWAPQQDLDLKLLPAVAQGWVRWSLARRGLDPTLAAEAADVALAF